MCKRPTYKRAHMHTLMEAKEKGGGKEFISLLLRKKPEMSSPVVRPRFYLFLLKRLVSLNGPFLFLTH